MNCLLIAATVAEIAPLLDELRSSDEFSDPLELDVLITGVGLAGTSYSLTKQVHLKRPDLVIQAGLAGSFDKKYRLGSVLIVKDDRIADESVLDKGKLISLFDLGLREADAHPYRNEWLKNARNQLMKKTGLPLVKGISVNQLTSDKKTRKLYCEKYKATTESMEGAALHLVCLSEKIPFLQIRSISNFVGERDKTKWKLKRAVKALNREVKKLLLRYQSEDKKFKS